MRTLLWWLGLGALLVLLAQISGVRAQNPNRLDSAQRVQDACAEAGRVPGPYGCVERSSGFTFLPPWETTTRPSMTIGIGKTFVTISPDGEVKYGDGYTPDAAAKAFWDAVGIERKARNCQ